jgi:hypothetical protein
MMDQQGFRSYLQTRQMPADKIELSVSIVERFESFLQETDHLPDGDGVRTFSARLLREHLNTFDHYLALARYGQFTKNYAIYIAVVELLDGHEALENLYNRLGEAIGERKRDEVFEGIDLPPPGTPSAEKAQIMRRVMERVNRLVDPAVSKKILSNSLRDLGGDERHLAERQKYVEAGSVDGYLARKGQDFIAQLEQIKRDGSLYFTQEITDEVIAFVEAHPEIRQGVREGSVIYEIKIPYMTRAYLAETDPRMKRYYYCHCPWVRESIKSDKTVSPTFCQCSIGFVKKPWEVIFDQALEGEIVESVLQGDAWCRIAIYLPDGVQ